MYYMMYLLPAFVALLYAGKPSIRVKRGSWVLVAFIYILLIGLRMSGGDWYNYLRRFEQMAYLTLDQALAIKDPGYQLISYYMYHWDLGFFAVTLIAAVISVSGLFIFLRSQINPWIGLAVSVPYLIIVVYMGYMRQGIALGLIMWGIVALERGRFYRFLAFVALAVTFHKSAILMIAFGIFSQGKGKLLKFFGVLAAGAGVWSSFVSSGADALITNYVDAQMQSSGAVIRVLLNAVPAVLLLVYRKEWKRSFSDYTFWFMISLASLAAIGLVSFASTAVDRMALYFLPLQLVVFSRLPYLARKKVSPKVTTVLIILFYLLIFSVWLNFAANVRFWLPYRNFLWADLF
ncbi:MAG: EpsG family protein [Campylobacterota bacterium]|nr:EpsG family protein [Campylobacterota bacterium]